MVELLREDAEYFAKRDSVGAGFDNPYVNTAKACVKALNMTGDLK